MGNNIEARPKLGYFKESIENNTQTKDYSSCVAVISKWHKPATQSGNAKNNIFQFTLLDKQKSKSRSYNFLMDWVSSAETVSSMKLSFPSLESAIEHAKNLNVEYIIDNSCNPKIIKKKSYLNS